MNSFTCGAVTWSMLPHAVLEGNTVATAEAVTACPAGAVCQSAVG
jgi:hypothetical protein